MKILRYNIYICLLLLHTVNPVPTQPLTKQNLALHNKIAPPAQEVVSETDSCLDRRNMIFTKVYSKNINPDINRGGQHVCYFKALSNDQTRMCNEKRARIHDYLNDCLNNQPPDQIEEYDACTDTGVMFSDVESLNSNPISCVSDLDKSLAARQNPLSLSQNQPTAIKVKKVNPSWWASCFTDNTTE